MNNYNFDLQDNLSAIYHYGVSVVADDDNKAYWTERLEKAISELGTTWRVSYESYKGASKKYKGWATVEVIADGGQTYGFRHHSQEAEKIHAVIRDVWMKVNHGDFNE